MARTAEFLFCTEEGFPSNTTLSKTTRYISRYQMKMWTKSAGYITCYVSLKNIHCSVYCCKVTGWCRRQELRHLCSSSLHVNNKKHCTWQTMILITANLKKSMMFVMLVPSDLHKLPDIPIRIWIHHHAHKSATEGPSLIQFNLSILHDIFLQGSS
jgi:hypothetical protein